MNTCVPRSLNQFRVDKSQTHVRAKAKHKVTSNLSALLGPFVHLAGHFYEHYFSLLLPRDHDRHVRNVHC